MHHVYCWHGLPAYWGGVMPDSPALAGMPGGRLVFPRPTDSIAEVEPSLLWSPAVLAGALLRFALQECVRVACVCVVHVCVACELCVACGVL